MLQKSKVWAEQSASAIVSPRLGIGYGGGRLVVTQNALIQRVEVLVARTGLKVRCFSAFETRKRARGHKNKKTRQN